MTTGWWDRYFFLILIYERKWKTKCPSTPEGSLCNAVLGEAPATCPRHQLSKESENQQAQWFNPCLTLYMGTCKIKIKKHCTLLSIGDSKGTLHWQWRLYSTKNEDHSIWRLESSSLFVQGFHRWTCWPLTSTENHIWLLLVTSLMWIYICLRSSKFYFKSCFIHTVLILWTLLTIYDLWPSQIKVIIFTRFSEFCFYWLQMAFDLNKNSKGFLCSLHWLRQTCSTFKFYLWKYIA